MTALSTNLQPATLPADPDWWRGAVIYQIYPRSFQDSTGDGIGDLAGIAQRLPYVASLGVDAIWISPIYTSPMKDFGYDVSDYCDIDPMFGTLADFDHVVETAHALGVRVMIDLVLSHTSDQHPWFVESRANRDNDRADWYVWAEPKPDGTPPNNWLSIFGGSAWTWDTRREQYYMHNFLVEQPDLNFHNMDVQDALLDVARFWLDRGVDGFRLDTLNFYVHDTKLRDNPALAKERRNATTAPAVNPYNHQEHLYDKNRPENLEFVKRLRAVLDIYGAAAVGEIGDGQIGLELIGDYTAGNDKIQMCYAFEFLAPDRPTAKDFATVLGQVDDKFPDGWACWAFSNHDCVRHTSRWGLTPDAQRLFVTLMMCLRGSTCIYQGEELGLGEAEVAFEDLQDPYGIQFWPEFKGRDGCRTPMVWEPSNQNGGFSDARPWLPVSADHVQANVATQEGDPSAMVHHYRRAIALRRDHMCLVKGDHDGVKHNGNIAYFTRTHDGESLLCAFNISDDPSEMEIPPGQWTPIGADLGGASLPSDGQLNLGPWQVFLALGES